MSRIGPILVARKARRPATRRLEMIELECPMCDEATVVAFDATELRCEGCAISVGIYARPAERAFVLSAAA